MNILFVCSRNKWRSLTAEKIYKDRPGCVVKSAGTEPSARVRVSSKHVLWADTIFAMERNHKQRLLEKFPREMKNKRVIVLDIEDEYRFMDKELIEIIKCPTDPHL